ncbi:hypothetical protein [Staphylococcus xylosus]
MYNVYKLGCITITYITSQLDRWWLISLKWGNAYDGFDEHWFSIN